MPTKLFENLFSAEMSEVWWGSLLGKCLFDEKFFLGSTGRLTGRNIDFEEFLKIFKLIRCTLLKWMHKSTILHWRLRFYWDAALDSFQMLNFSHHSIFPHIKLSWSLEQSCHSPSDSQSHWKDQILWIIFKVFIAEFTIPDPRSLLWQ